LSRTEKFFKIRG